MSKATEVLNGELLIPLPKSKQKTYSAMEIGDMFGISATMVGRIANKHNLKVSNYGEYYRNKSKYFSKEVDSFVYFDTAISEFEKILKKKAAVTL